MNHRQKVIIHNAAIERVLEIVKSSRTTTDMIKLIQCLTRPLPPSNITEEVEAVKQAWLDCLTHRGNPRAIFGGEDMTMLRQIKAKGLDAVLLAIRGAKQEEMIVNFGYNPATWFSLERIFEHKNFGRYVNQGAAHKQKELQDNIKRELKLRHEAEEQAAYENFRAQKENPDVKNIVSKVFE